MTIEEIKILKDKVYELEGLLELAQLREDKISELEPLIIERINDLTDVKETVNYNREERREESEGRKIIKEREDREEIGTIGPEEPGIADVSENGLEYNVADYSASVPVPADMTGKPSARKPAFCLNDRFRFRRELFSNSDAEFSAAMNMIAAMDNYEEAEEYFIGQLGWESENPEVADFMEIIKGYFES